MESNRVGRGIVEVETGERRKGRLFIDLNEMQKRRRLGQRK